MENVTGKGQSNNDIEEEIDNCIVPQTEEIVIQSLNNDVAGAIENAISRVEVKSSDQLDGLNLSCLKKIIEDEKLLDQSRRSPTYDRLRRNVPGEATAPVHVNDEHYNMNHKNRGLAIILNHTTFVIPDEHRKYDPRHGTEHDVESLKRSLSKLGFKVDCYSDSKYSDIMNLLEKVSKMDHSDNDCFLLACLTHGEDNNVLCAHNELYSLNDLYDPLDARHCPTLAGKPKLFIIQACRGKTLDAGVILKEQERTIDTSVFRTDDASITDSAACSYKIPSRVDFITFFSTVSGYVSFLTPRGSPFIQILCEVLDDYAYTKDIDNIFKLVTRKVCLTYESNVPGKEDEDYKKMAPEVSSSLFRCLNFTPKEVNEVIKKGN